MRLNVTEDYTNKGKEHHIGRENINLHGDFSLCNQKSPFICPFCITRNVLAAELESGYALPFPTLFHLGAKEESKPVAVWWINHYILRR